MNASDPDVQRMLKAARGALKNAYCPYSRFPVGAAVISAEGEIFAACNVENASYGLTMCAERSAIFQAIAKNRRDLKALVVVTPTRRATPPCGACRQVMNEFNPEADVFICGQDDQPQHFKLSELLKAAFGPLNMT